MRHPAVSGARATLARHRELSDAARAGYWPRVQAEVTSGEQGEFGYGEVATVGLTQMLYDFGKTRTEVERERAGVRREEAAILQAIDDVVDGTMQALIGAHRQQALERIGEGRIEALRRVQDITEARAAAGAAPRSDPVQARARVEAAQSFLQEARSQMRQWRSRLETYLGPIVPDEIGAAPAGLLEGVGLATDEDLRRSPAMRIAEAERDAAEAEFRNARAQRFPTISLEANANRRLGTAGERYEDIYGKSTYGTAFVSISSSLYEGGRLAAQSRAGAHAVEAAEARLQTQRLLARDALRGHRERIDGLERRLVVLEHRLRSITETRALYWDQYLSLGTRNALDLLNAEQELSQSKEDLANARHDLWSARWAYIMGAGWARDAFDLDIRTERTP